MQKLPHITALFWIIKICATTLGETAGDLLSMTLHIGYAASSVLLLSIFLMTLVMQLRAKQFHPLLYWMVILSTSTAGTTLSDYMDRTLQLGYAQGSLILVTLLVTILAFWRVRLGSLSLNTVKTPSTELLYWTAILCSNTLGTALGDYLADDSGLGFAGGALLISVVLGIIWLLHYTKRFSAVALFWAAFVLTRPFGATFGDWMTKPLAKGGLDLGTIGASAVLFVMLVGLIVYTMSRKPVAPLS